MHGDASAFCRQSSKPRRVRVWSKVAACVYARAWLARASDQVPFLSTWSLLCASGPRLHLYMPATDAEWERTDMSLAHGTGATRTRMTRGFKLVVEMTNGQVQRRRFISQRR